MTTQLSPAQLNAIARQNILATALERTQQIYSQTVTPAQQNVLNVAPAPVGLTRGFIVEIAATVKNSDGTLAANLTDFNVANLLSNISFVDLGGVTRINTTGWHLNFLDTAKHGRVSGSSVASDSPIKYGSNETVIAAPASLAAGASGTVTMRYWVPLAYSKADLRGSCFLGVVNAVANLALTINPSIGAAAATDDTLAVYNGTANVAVQTATVTVYQVYYDQLPLGNGGPVLPLLDVSTIYELKNTALAGIVANQDFPVSFSNFRTFLSTFLIYDQAGTRNNGTDINSFSLQAANSLNIFKVSPQTLAFKNRSKVSTDFPKGTHYFDFRDRPLSTIQYGNLNLNLNASSAAAGSSVLCGWEAFALTNTITGAGSLAAS